MNIHIAILGDGDAVMEYAAAEIKQFLNTYTTVLITKDEKEADAGIELETEETMESHVYALEGDGARLLIRGGSSSAVLCGVYEAFGDAGLMFEAVGCLLPGTLDLETLFSIKKTVRPKCRMRGIRQHINFPMDISSYSLKDAQEYIRSMARMRFNAITFHSYGGQWHSTVPGDPQKGAGHFFYGQRHPLPKEDPVTAKRIHNRRYYCIPEAEEILDDPAALDAYARYWLGEVMDTAKRAGMTVTMSVELPFDDVPRMCAMLRDVCQSYPQMDVLELISYESGGGDCVEHLTYETMPQVLAEMFGKEIFDQDGRLAGMGSGLPKQLGGGAVSLKRILTAFSVREKWLTGLEHRPRLQAGLYLTCADTLKILWPIMRRLLPGDVTKSLLPAHGSLAVAKSVETIGTNGEDWQNTMYYTWAEFDGNMYLQQLPADGLEKLIFMEKAESIRGFCINHWRTSENRIAIAYAAEAAICPVRTEEFYAHYAARLGIRTPDLFAAACTRLAQLDTYCRDHLFNIGFCFVRCWFHTDEIAHPRGYDREAQEYAIGEYEAIVMEYENLLPFAASQESIALLRMFANRCRTSAMHIRSMLTLEELHNVYDYNQLQRLSDAQREAADAIIDRSFQWAQDYIHEYGEVMPDRGCEGLLASYCETVPVYIRAVAEGIRGEGQVCDMPGDTFDAPPSPDEEVK